MRLYRLLLVFTAISSCLATHPSRADGPPPLPTLRMLNLWTFHPTNLSAGFGALPLLATNVERVASWSDEALQIDSAQPAWLRFREAETNGRANLLCTNGTVLFWFKPNWSGTNVGGSGPGTWARFLEVGTLTTNAAIGWWSLYLDPTGTRLRLAAQASGNSAIFLECPVAWPSNVWHHVAVTYSPSNSALYLDGQWMTNGAGISLVPGPQVRTNGFLIGSDSTGLAQMRGQMDWLQTFNEPMSSSGIANIFQARQPPGWQESLVIGGESGLGMGTIGEGTGLILDGGLDGGGMNAMGSYAATDLWLELSLTLTNTALVTVHNTGTETNYLLLSTTAIGGSNWVVEQYFLGATGQTFTTLLVPLNNRPTLFFTVGSSDDADGDGLPDAYERFVTGTDPDNPDTGGTGISDGYKDSDADGWCNLDELRNGTNPSLFNTPPPPQGVRVVYDPVNDTATISWDASRATPEAYVVHDYSLWPEDEVGTTSGTSLMVTNAGSPWTSYFWKAYNVCAVYPSGIQSCSDYLSSGEPAIAMSSVCSQGPDGRGHLLFSPWPTNIASLHVTIFNWDGALGPLLVTEWDIPASRVQDGKVELTDEEYAYVVTYGAIFCSIVAVDGAGRYGVPARLDYVYDRNFAQVWGNTHYVADMSEIDALRFYDASQHLKQNLRFLLRAAPKHRPFAFYPNESNLRENGFCYRYWARPTTTPGYEFSSYRQLSYHSFLERDEMWPAPLSPLVENQLFRNFIFSLDDFGGPPGYSWQTGVSFSDYYILSCGQPEEYGRIIANSKYHYTYSGTGTPTIPSAVLGGSATDWLRYHSQSFVNSCQDHFGFGWTGNGQLPNFLETGQYNYFGLPVAGVKVSETLKAPATWANYAPGQPIPRGSYWMNVADPVLQTIDYYFSPGFDLMPGLPDFRVTNSSPVLVAPFGSTSTFAAWAKQRIVNGDPNKFAYLEQFFEKAYLADAYGNITTNEAGILSEYGDFLPTHAGQVSLTTKPDPDQGGLQGTATVHVVKLQLDVNHDGMMDLFFAGPDNTSAERPFRFWVNNDFDRLHSVDCPLACDTEQDDLGAKDIAQLSAYQQVPDCNYVSASGQPAIPFERDLEDYSRLWIPGLASVMAAMPASYTVKLVLLGDAQLRIFRAYEPDGGTNYLFNEGTASNQVAHSASLYVGLLTASSPVVLNGLTNLGEHFIWCGAQRGNAQVHLQILDDSQTLVADTAAYVEIKDIKEMYERWTAGDNGSVPPAATAYLASEDLPSGVPRFQYDPPSDTNTPYILHVHGWNMERWDKDRFGETMFKRLYWQGYDGRFGIFRWPTLAKFPEISGEGADLNHFDKSEHNAWRSGAALRKLLISLDSKYPGQVRLSAHSMGNVVAGETLRTNTTLVSVYVAMQGAVPSGAYDLAAPFRAIPVPAFDGTTELYRFYPLFTPTRPYFNFAAGAAVYINFYNPVDWALNLWITDQNVKPAGSLGYSFDSATSTFYQFRGQPSQRILTCPANAYELFAYGVEGQCYALGAQANAGGVFTTASQVNLDNAYSFGNLHKGHSAQFRSTNMKRAGFWDALADKLQILPP